jgi:hypothetical protein
MQVVVVVEVMEALLMVDLVEEEMVLQILILLQVVL